MTFGTGDLFQNVILKIFYDISLFFQPSPHSFSISNGRPRIQNLHVILSAARPVWPSIAITTRMPAIELQKMIFFCLHEYICINWESKSLSLSMIGRGVKNSKYRMSWLKLVFGYSCMFALLIQLSILNLYINYIKEIKLLKICSLFKECDNSAIQYSIVFSVSVEPLNSSLLNFSLL